MSVLGCVLAVAIACGSVIYPEAGATKGSDERILSFDTAGLYGKGFIRKAEYMWKYPWVNSA